MMNYLPCSDFLKVSEIMLLVTLRGWIILSNSHIELLRENFLKDFAHTFQKTRKKREIMKIKPHYFSLLRKIRKSVSMDKVEILFKYLILPF